MPRNDLNKPKVKTEMAAIAKRTPDIYRELSGFSREPFLRALVHCLHAEPDWRTLHKFARANPEKWGSLLSVLAKLAGFNETLQIDGHVVVDPATLSDMQIEQRLRDLSADLGQGSLRSPVAQEQEIEDAVLVTPLEPQA